MNHLEHKNHEEHDKHKGHTPEMFSRRFWVSLILTLPILAYSDIFQAVFRFKFPAFYGSEYLVLILGTAIFFYGGLPFLNSAFSELKMKLPGMMTLVALAISTAYFYGVYAVLFARTPDKALFWELATLITVMLAGHWLEMRAVAGASRVLRELAKLLPDEAEVVRGEKIEKVQLEKLKLGDVVFVRPGGKIPADGAVLEGISEVNEAVITGESRPVKKSAGAETIAGAINGDGALKIKITKIRQQTFLAGVARLIAEAEASKSRLQTLSDRAAFYLTLVAVFSGGLAFAIWIWIKGDVSFALERLVAVLVIACPHALGLAVPLVASISTSLAAKNGLLVKRRLSLEAARKIDVVLFDKTGTLTRGEYGVTRIIINERGYDKNKILQSAASVDAVSEHFIAKAIVKEARKNNLTLLPAEDFKRIPGKGTKAVIKGNAVFVGGEAILIESGVAVQVEIKVEIEKLAREGKTIIYVIANNKLIGAIALADVIREESKEAISELRKMGVKTAMITGDSEEVAKWVAKELGVDKYFAKVLPAGKVEMVKRLQNSKSKYLNSKQSQNSNNRNFKRFGMLLFKISRIFRISDLGFRISANQRFVAMVGDGINDAPALTQADLGVAIGAGTNVAIESAGIILVRNDPRDVVKIIKLSRLTYSKMIQNLFWATGYNIIALPLAAGILANYGVMLQPAISAVFMSASTIIVAANAAFLRKAKLD